RKRHLPSASAPFICERRPSTSRARITYAAPPASTDLGPACDHLPDRGMALGSPRTGRGHRRGGDPAARVQGVAGGPRRFAVARDDADRVHRSGVAAVSAEADRILAAHPRILDERLRHHPVREIPRRRGYRLPLRRYAAEAPGNELIRKAP